MRGTLFMPINPRMSCNINGKLETSAQARQESIFGVVKELFEEFVEIFKRANKVFEALYSHHLRAEIKKIQKDPNAQKPDQQDEDTEALPEQIKIFIESVFECFKRVMQQVTKLNLSVNGFVNASYFVRNSCKKHTMIL